MTFKKIILNTGYFIITSAGLFIFIFLLGFAVKGLWRIFMLGFNSIS